LQGEIEEKMQMYNGIRDQISDVDKMMRKVLDVLPKSIVPLKVEMSASQLPKLIDSCKELKELAVQRNVSP
jgi:hypothetical protein